MILHDQLATAYRRHFEWHTEFRLSARQPSRALGWEATLWLVDTLTARGDQRVLECGSGWSTTALRLWAAQDPARVIVTTDHRKNWLNRTRMELEKEHLSTSHLYVHETFIGNDHAYRFDLVLLDLADTPTRQREIDHVLDLLSPWGLLVFDDWHITSYADAVNAAFRERGLTIPEPQLNTRDDYGRLVATWSRSGQ